MKLADELPDALREVRPIRVLERSLEQGRLAHAILLTGDGIGLLEEIAEAIARVLLDAPGTVSEHPDYFTLRPAKKSRQIRAVADQGKVEPNTMRWLLRQLQQTPSRADRKVAVIREADRMTTVSANAFLKTLEEPPADTTIILLTERPYDLLDTIRSRCFVFRLPTRLDALDNEAWNTWRADFSGWLAQVARRRRDSESVASAIMRLYGLLGRFHRLADEFAQVAWKTEKERLPDETSAEERDAHEVGVKRGIRDGMLKEVEETVQEYTRHALGQATGDEPERVSRAGIETVEALERAVGLLAVNFNETAAMERFLLQSLRAWGR